MTCHDSKSGHPFSAHALLCMLAITLAIGCSKEQPVEIPIFVDHGGSNEEPTEPDPDGDDMIQ